jgi:hypothetical protein
MPDNSLGYCDSNALQILIRQRLRKSKSQELLVHEILHAIILQSLTWEKKHEDEDFILATAPHLLQVMQDNPELLAYLTQ